MTMTIDDSERYLKLMLGGMKYAVQYWKDKDKEESDIEQTNVEAVETALDIMRKYQKIEQIVREQPAITEQEIVKSYLEKLKEQVSHCNLCLLVNKEDVLGFIDNLLSESEG